MLFSIRPAQIAVAGESCVGDRQSIAARRRRPTDRRPQRKHANELLYFFQGHDQISINIKMKSIVFCSIKNLE